MHLLGILSMLWNIILQVICLACQHLHYYVLFIRIESSNIGVSISFYTSLHLHLLWFTTCWLALWLHLLRTTLLFWFWFGLCCIFSFLLFFWRRWRSRFGHNFLDLLIDFLDLVLDISSCDSKRFMFRKFFLLLVSLNSPLLLAGNKVVSFLPFFRRDMLILLILNKNKNTKELSCSKLLLRHVSRLCN